MQRPTILALFTGCLAATSVLGEPRPDTSVSQEDELARIEAPSLRLGLTPKTGQLVEILDPTLGQNLIHSHGNPGGLWAVEVSGSSPVVLTPTQAGAFEVAALEGPQPGLRLDWSRFELSEAPDLHVEVTVRLDGAPALSRWQITVEQTGQRTVQAIRFPRVLNLARLGDERLAVPSWVGQLATEPRRLLTDERGQGRRREYEYPGLLSMQCLAYYSEHGPGLYTACDDAAGYRKTFAVFGGPDASANFEVIHWPERGGPNAGRFALPYSVVLGAFRGDWFDAARIYRGWATNQVWARESRWKRGRVPKWIADTGLWIWNRGRSPGVLEPALCLQQESGLPVSVFWHWWHGCAYDTGFPEYLPPREGAAAFQHAVARAREHQVRSLVYMNQRLWGMTTASWTNENAARYAVKNAGGQIQPEIYNRYTRLPCATMCMGTPFWRAKYAGLAADAFNTLGVDGIYMDQACSSLACFDPEHGHPLGGGTYWMNGFRTLAADLRDHCQSRGGVALAGEGCAENWLPYLDLMLALDISRERYAGPDGWDVIPFFHAVYAGYGVFYGNYSSLTLPPYDDLWPSEFAPKEPLKRLDRRFSCQFYLEQARSFVWGQQPTLANFLPALLQERPQEMAYFLRLARVRSLATRFLQDGEMLPSPTLDAPSAAIDLSRLSIYAGQREALKEFRKTVALALAAARRTPDGTVGIALASIADRPLHLNLRFETAAYGLQGNEQVHRLDETGRTCVGLLTNATSGWAVDLPPLGACVLEFTRHAR